MDDYLTKPFSTVGLSTTVSKWISSATPGPPTPAPAPSPTVAKIRQPLPEFGAAACTAPPP